MPPDEVARLGDVRLVPGMPLFLCSVHSIIT
jgi:hypothetical protein